MSSRQCPKFAAPALIALTAVIALTASATQAAERVYSSTGSNGEPRFSDAPSPDAEELYVFAPTPSAAEAERTRQRTADQLAAAETLSEARKARESAYREARVALAQQAPLTYQPRDSDRYDRYHRYERYGYPIYWPPYQRPVRPPLRPRPPATGPETGKRPFAPVFNPAPPALRN